MAGQIGLVLEFPDLIAEVEGRVGASDDLPLLDLGGDFDPTRLLSRALDDYRQRGARSQNAVGVVERP